VSIDLKSIETKTKRLGLAIQGKPYWLRVGSGISLGYRRTEGAGTWSVRIADGKGGGPIKRIGTADDHVPADGKNILTFAQAQAAALQYVTSGGKAPVKVTTLGEAIDAYEADLDDRKADLGNARRLRGNLSPVMLKRPTASLTAKELSAWRKMMVEQDFAPSSVNRLIFVFKAALNLAATHTPLDPKVWKDGLKTLPNARRARNNVQTQATIVALVHAAREIERELGLMVEVLAQTGARYSQVARCEVRDLHDDRLAVPSSLKGKNKKATVAMIPLPADLIARLRLAAGDRPGSARLLLKAGGTPWIRRDLDRRFGRVVKVIGEDPKALTSYALRHTHITAQLLARIPVALVAKLHDTSVKMIEEHYAEAIASHSDDLVRGAMMAIDQAAANVVPLRSA